MRIPFRFRRGFTLIELLTVIAIIGILAGITAKVIPMVKRRANIAASKSTFQQICTAVEMYKTAYGTYPYLNNQYETSKDTFIQLNSTATVEQFVKALSGKNPIWDQATELSAADRKINNKNATPFFTFPSDVIGTDDGGNYTKLLTDKFGNTQLNLLMDTDNNGMVKPTNITGIKSDYGIDQNGNINRKVILYTLKGTDAEHEDILSWQ